MKLQFLNTLKDIQKDIQAQRTIELVVNSILVILLVALVGRSVTVSVLSMRTQKQDLNTIASALKVKRTSIQAAEDEINSYTSSFDLLSEAMPLSPKQFDMLNQIQLAAETEGVAIDQLNHKAGSAGIVEFSATGNGKYEQIVRFIKRVEKLPRIIQLNSVSLNGNSESEVSDPNISFSIGGVGYYYADTVTLLDSDNTVQE